MTFRELENNSSFPSRLSKFIIAAPEPNVITETGRIRTRKYQQIDSYMVYRPNQPQGKFKNAVL